MYLPPALDFSESTKTGDLYYVGDRLSDCLRTVELDRHIKTLLDGDTVRVELCDDPEGELGAEWGAGATVDEAMRYAVAAFFGPLDEGFDGEAPSQ